MKLQNDAVFVKDCFEGKIMLRNEEEGSKSIANFERLKILMHWDERLRANHLEYFNTKELLEVMDVTKIPNDQQQFLNHSNST